MALSKCVGEHEYCPAIFGLCSSQEINFGTVMWNIERQWVYDTHTHSYTYIDDIKVGSQSATWSWLICLECIWSQSLNERHCFHYFILSLSLSPFFHLLIHSLTSFASNTHSRGKKKVSNVRRTRIHFAQPHIWIVLWNIYLGP